MPHPNYPEDRVWALPGACSEPPNFSHEEFYLMSDEDQRHRCEYCRLPYHSTVISIANRREKAGQTPMELSTAHTGQTNTTSTSLPATYRDLTMPQFPVSYQRSLPPHPPGPHGTGQRLEYPDQSTRIRTRAPTSPTDGGRANHGSRPLLFNPAPSRPTGGNIHNMEISNVLNNIDNGYAGVKKGYKEAKKINAEKNHRNRPSYEPDQNTTWLSIEWVHCQYYVADEAAGADGLELGMEIGRWLTTARVPNAEPDLKLDEWLGRLRLRLRGSQRSICNDAALVSFCDRIQKSRSKNQDQPPRVHWLDGYEQLTIHHILSREGMPWRAKKDSDRGNLFQAFVIIYRERVNSPPSRVRLATPYKEPPKPPRLATGYTLQDTNQDDDPFLEPLPSSDYYSTVASSQPTVTSTQQSRQLEERPRFRHYNVDSPTPPAEIPCVPCDQSPRSGSTLSPRAGETSNSLAQSREQGGRPKNASPPTLLTTFKASRREDVVDVLSSGSDTDSSIVSLGTYFARRRANNTSKQPGGRLDQEEPTTEQSQATATKKSSQELVANRNSQSPTTSTMTEEPDITAISSNKQHHSPTRDTGKEIQEDLTNLDEPETSSSTGVALIPAGVAHPKAVNITHSRPSIRKRNIGKTSSGSTNPLGDSGSKTHRYNTRKRSESYEPGYYGRLVSGKRTKL